MQVLQRNAGRRAPALIAASLAVLVGGMAPLASPASAQTATVNWITWTAPSTYGQTSAASGGISEYTYATEALGELELPGGPTVYVKLTGEIVNPALLAPVDTSCSGYCGPSGFTSDGTTRPDFWLQVTGSGSGQAFASDNVPFAALPTTNGDHIGLIGQAETGNPTQLLEFFSDSARTVPVAVSNIIMVIASMGSGNDNPATWDFTRDVVVLSDNEDLGFSGLARTVKDPGGTGADFQITGDEGTGTIQFIGSFESLSWTVSAPEIWASWNLGATSASPFPAPPAPAPTVAVDCRPDPVRAGEPVTCDVTGGDPGIDILWRASIDGAFAEHGVTLDQDGRGSFTFLAPRDADGRTIVVDLVEWNASDTVGVVGSVLPGRIPAGDGPADRAPAIVLLSAASIAAGLLGRRLTAGHPGRA